MNLIDKILEYISKDSKFADVRFIDKTENSIQFRNGEFIDSYYNHDSGYAVRSVNNSISMGFIRESSFEEIRKDLDNILKKSKMKGKNKIDDSGNIKDSWKYLGNKKVSDVSIEDKIGILKHFDYIMSDIHVKINNLNDEVVNEIYVNSSGSEINSQYSRIIYYYMIGILENNEFEQSSKEFGTTSGYEYFDKINFDGKINNDISSLKKSVHSKQIKPGKYDLVIGPEISGIVSHESSGHPMEYDRIIGREAAQAGESFIKNTKPLKIGSKYVNIIDDPTVKESYGYYLYDDEGTKARKRYLYKNGYTNEFILNRESAGILNVKSNGGGRASEWNMEPLARMSTTYIEPGDYSFEELVSDIKNGIYIKDFTEWNIDDIRFNEKYVGKEAYRIVNGKIGEQIRRPVIETNTINFFSSLDAVGNDLNFSAGICGKGDPEQGVNVWMGGPHARLRSVYIK